ncbi:hypothetical protein PZ897_10475 [Hoeflea sp. YIM 152468]|uniref:hypothetical protein n=1 Tax=Hoeflea sp. YIM 152468 TaxID=3031759 RepID=UPI0023D9AFBB|nr:hypothetical protein [Hoeflea sp. YIM 152468]MDF1608601.1 hypothetical protein [Hoeflea sp. YIM 152468]
MAATAVRKSQARLLATASIVACAMVPAAVAQKQPVYDRRIEEAAIRMLVPKLGDIRGSLDLKIEQHLYPAASERRRDRKAGDGPVQSRRRNEQGSILSY